MSRFTQRRLLILMVAATALTVASPHADAASITYASGPTTLGGVTVNVSAQFEFDPTNHKITLTLLNLQNNPTSLEQLIGGIRFTVTGAGTTLSTPAISSSGIGTFDVDVNGTPQTDTKSNTWNVSASGTQVRFCTICATSSGRELVIGGGSSTFFPTYGAAFRNTQNPFILGSNASYTLGALHNLDSSPSWVFSIASITSTVNVASVEFDFGLTYGDNLLVENPEPASLAMMLGGVGLLLGGLWKRRDRARKDSGNPTSPPRTLSPPPHTL